jgi:hypothetical protein
MSSKKWAAGTSISFGIALVHGGKQADRVACHLFRLRDADGDRLGDSDHPIERLNGALVHE